MRLNYIFILVGCGWFVAARTGRIRILFDCYVQWNCILLAVAVSVCVLRERIFNFYWCVRGIWKCLFGETGDALVYNKSNKTSSARAKCVRQ